MILRHNTPLTPGRVLHLVEYGLAAVLEQCYRLLRNTEGDQPSHLALLTLSRFLSQALDQRKARVKFKYRPCQYIEGQASLVPGVDILDDLMGINGDPGNQGV